MKYQENEDRRVKTVWCDQFIFEIVDSRSHYFLS